MWGLALGCDPAERRAMLLAVARSNPALTRLELGDKRAFPLELSQALLAGACRACAPSRPRACMHARIN
jgi:hypothetical protein